MIRSMRYLLLLSLFLLANYSKAQQFSVDNFIIKESILNNDKISIIATDANQVPVEGVKGTFQFTINGFKEDLTFRNGVATPARPVDKSSFVYIKHRNDKGTHAALYYIVKVNGSLKLFRISWFMLLIIPVVLIVLGMMFRKFIIFAIILLVILFIFNNSKGLGFFTFFETVYNGLKSVF